MSGSEGRNGPRFDVVVLAAGRGRDDAMAKAFSVRHKCLIDVAGTPMIVRVAKVLCACREVNRIAVSIEDPKLLAQAPGWNKLPTKRKITLTASAARISQSVIGAIDQAKLAYPVLITTADHPLLTTEMVTHFCSASIYSGADLTLGVAHEDVVKGAYPDAGRTYFKFADGRYSGCNLFVLLNPRGLNAVTFWQGVQKNRKRPWRIVRAFGIGRLARYLSGQLSLTEALLQASQLIDANVQAIRIPFAEAAVDVDKPADLELAESILALRASKSQMINVDLDARAEPEAEIKPKRKRKKAKKTKKTKS